MSRFKIKEYWRQQVAAACSLPLIIMTSMTLPPFCLLRSLCLYYQIIDLFTPEYFLKESISPLALNIPGIDSYLGLIHTLFALEDRYGLTIETRDGEVIFRIDPIYHLQERQKALRCIHTAKGFHNMDRFSCKSEGITPLPPNPLIRRINGNHALLSNCYQWNLSEAGMS
jgi:hypothetical protein